MWIHFTMLWWKWCDNRCTREAATPKRKTVLQVVMTDHCSLLIMPDWSFSSFAFVSGLITADSLRWYLHSRQARSSRMAHGHMQTVSYKCGGDIRRLASNQQQDQHRGRSTTTPLYWWSRFTLSTCNRHVPGKRYDATIFGGSVHSFYSIYPIQSCGQPDIPEV